MSLSAYVPIVGLFALGGALRAVLGRRSRRSSAHAVQPGQARRLRVRHRADPAAGRRRPVPGQVLPDRDALHRLRHRDHLPVPVGGLASTRSACSGSSRWSCSSSPSSSRTPTCGGAAAWTGTEATMGIEEKLPERHPADHRREAGQLGAQVVSFWPATFGLACCAIEMMADRRGRATTSAASAWRSSGPRPARPT